MSSLGEPNHIPRRVWVVIEGLPISSWCKDNFVKIIGGRGTILEVAQVLLDDHLLRNPRVLIETTTLFPGSWRDKVQIAGKVMDILIGECRDEVDIHSTDSPNDEPTAEENHRTFGHTQENDNVSQSSKSEVSNRGGECIYVGREVEVAPAGSPSNMIQKDLVSHDPDSKKVVKGEHSPQRGLQDSGIVIESPTEISKICAPHTVVLDESDSFSQESYRSWINKGDFKEANSQDSKNVNNLWDPRDKNEVDTSVTSSQSLSERDRSSSTQSHSILSIPKKSSVMMKKMEKLKMASKRGDLGKNLLSQV